MLLTVYPSPPPQLLHSQETDYQATHLAAEPSTKLLFTAAQDTRPGQTAEYVTVHSMDPDSGMLAFKYRWAWVKGCVYKGQGDECVTVHSPSMPDSF